MKNNALTLTLNLENLSKEEYIKLLELAEKAKEPISKVWKPKEFEKYYYIEADGSSHSGKWHNADWEKFFYSIGNCYSTKEAAEFARGRQKVHTALQRYAEEHNTGKINWNNRNQLKYFIRYIHTDAPHLGVSVLSIHQDMGTIYFTSKEIAEAAIKEIGEDNIKKYLFGIEM